MVDFPLRSVDKEVHQLKLITIITERGGVGGCSRNLCNPRSNLSGMSTGILQQQYGVLLARLVVPQASFYRGLGFSSKLGWQIGPTHPLNGGLSKICN